LKREFSRKESRHKAKISNTSRFVNSSPDVEPSVDTRFESRLERHVKMRKPISFIVPNRGQILFLKIFEISNSALAIEEFTGESRRSSFVLLPASPS